ncbi:ABC transporter permease [Bacillaceae bacterium S4-13-56]
MATALYGALESGLIYAIMALGVYLSFRVLDFPDLTVDGSFVTGAAVSSVLIVNGGMSPVLAVVIGGVAGFLAGCITGLIHTKGKINPLLAGILMMIALYSINLRIMGRPNIPLFNQSTVFEPVVWLQWLNEALMTPFTWLGITDYAPKTFQIIITMFLVVVVMKKAIDWLLRTEMGLALRATGDNDRMVKSLSANTDRYTIVGLGLSNGLVAISGGLIAQYNGSSDAGMGIGIIIVGLASVIIGEAIVGTQTVLKATLAAVIGAIVYRFIIALALRIDFLSASDMKLITAIIVIVALVLPSTLERLKQSRSRYLKQKSLSRSQAREGRNSIATTKTDS